MCNMTGIQFGRTHLSQSEILNKKVIEIGARDVNGSLRDDIVKLNPTSYLGVDMVEGKGVDELCDVTDLIGKYGSNSFDVVISTELMEHVKDWRAAISNMKSILKPNGILLFTTRSIGFGYHGFPFDFWRYEVEDIKQLFSDFQIVALEKDTDSPGVFLKAIKPADFLENNLSKYRLFSIVKNKRSKGVNGFDIMLFKTNWNLILILKKILPVKLKQFIRKVFLGEKI
jgi:SAM-dependent methyltransferase